MTKSFGDRPDPEQLSPLVLAYIGDAVYELFVRQILVSRTSCPVRRLHSMTTKQVNCAAQAAAFHRIESRLTEAELAVFRRGRNTKSNVPKNADMADYRTATGLEALFGYWYCKDEMDKIWDTISYLLKEDKDGN